MVTGSQIRQRQGRPDHGAGPDPPVGVDELERKYTSAWSLEMKKIVCTANQHNHTRIHVKERTHARTYTHTGTGESIN